MGSSAGGSYSGKSQPYASSYHVESSMHQKDIRDEVYHNGHYDKNPTAKNLNDAINGNYIGDKRTNAEIIFLIDTIYYL